MDNSTSPLIFIAFVGIAIVIRLVAGRFDGERVEQHIRDMGGTLLNRSWDPLGPGWFGEKNARIYKIQYRDRDGAIHDAHVKTSLLSGVYLTNDRVIRPVKRKLNRKAKKLTLQPLPIDLAAENARLRQRVRELEANKS